MYLSMSLTTFPSQLSALDQDWLHILVASWVEDIQIKWIASLTN